MASLSSKDIINVIQAQAAAEDICDALRIQLAEHLKSAKATAKQAKAMKAALKQYVTAHFGESSPALGDFGYSPRKVSQKTVTEKYLTVEKQLATRAARHTMGSHQKASIHGVVPQAPTAPVQAPPVVVVNGTNGIGH